MGDRVNFGIYRVRRDDLSVQHEGAYRRGTEWHRRARRILPLGSTSAFDETGIYARFRDDYDI